MLKSIIIFLIQIEIILLKRIRYYKRIKLGTEK